MSSELNLIQYFKEFNNTLNNLDMSINVYDLSTEKNLSINQSQFVLNSFILNNADLGKYIIIYRAEILEFDQTNNNQKITMKYFPSYLDFSSVVFNTEKQQLLDLGVYCILNKSNDFVLNDYNINSHEMKKLDLLNLDDYEYENISNIHNIKNDFNNTEGRQATSNIIVNSKSKNNFDKSFQEKISINKGGKLILF